MEGLDETIAPLVSAMNRMPFISTLSSCGGHPEESSVREYGYAVADIVFEIEDESENAILWYSTIQDVLRRRRAWQPQHELGIIFAKKYALSSDGYLGWHWGLKLQATGKTAADCRAGLDEGISFLTDYFNEVAE